MNYKPHADNVILYQMGEDAKPSDMVGTVFYKQLVAFGDWVDPYYPVEVMTLDKEWANQIKKNFDAKVIDRVPVPYNHTDDVEANTGEVIKLEVKDDGLYGYIDIRRQEAKDDIENELIFDVSISFDWDYRDTQTGKHHGPVLFHVALVNNPYLKGMAAFEPAKAGSFSEKWGEFKVALAKPDSASAIMLSKSKYKELNMQLSKITNDKEYAVTVPVKTDDDVVETVIEPGAEIEVPEDQVEDIKAAIESFEAPTGDEEKDGDEDKDGEGEEDTRTEEEKQAEKDQKELSRLRKAENLHKTESAYAKLLSEGKITPAQKDAYMQLSEFRGTKVELSDGKKKSVSSIVNSILKSGPKVIKFSEDGSSAQGDEDADADKEELPSKKLSAEELKGMQATGASPEKLDELSKKYPEMAAVLNEDNKEEEK